MDLTGCGLSDPQTQLAAALANRNIKEFQAALQLGAQPNLEDERHASIYEKALSTPGCAEFIEACLAHGCNANHINLRHNKAAISYVCDSRDPLNLAVLLRRPQVLVDRKYGHLTPLHSLAKNLKPENVEQVHRCMQQLLDYGASPNVVDQGDQTPLHLVLRNNRIPPAAKQELVKLFLQQPNLDIDTYRNGEVRQMLTAQYPELQLPPQRPVNDDGEIDFERLLRQLRDGDESQFEQLLAEHKLNISDQENQRNVQQEQYLPLLMESIKLGKQSAFEAILQTGINFNQKPLGQASSAVELAIIWGNWRALETLLQHSELRLEPGSRLLNAVISRLGQQPLDSFCDYSRCFELLLDSPLVEINEQDASGQVPLYYAVKYRNMQAVQTLLSHGAYIGAKSIFGELAIEDMWPELLEQHFDSCITTNAQKAGDQNFEIIIDYKNLMRQQPILEQQTLKGRPMPAQDEMTPIACIAKSKELRHLLQHPLISSFLFLKWHRLSLIFYINFVIYAFFTGSIIVYTLLKFHESSHSALTALFAIFSWVGICYLIIRELIQLLMAPKWSYFRSLTNVLEVALIVLSIMTCKESSFDRETQRVLAVFTILLVALELCLLVGSLPVLSISTHMLMLRAVSSSFMKSFGLYSIFVGTFSLCFYILFGKPQEQQEQKEPQEQQSKPGAEEDSSFNSFSKPVEAVIKTIVMLTGEFDASSIKFDNATTYFIFLLFVLFMTIVLFNLLNGLAVSDTQAIKAQAELNGAICRTNTLLRYEQKLMDRKGRIGYLMSTKLLRWTYERLIHVYPNYLGLRQISVLPNDGNKVLIPLVDPTEMRQRHNATFQAVPTNHDYQQKLLDPPLNLLPCCCSLLKDKCSRIDSRTVKLALAIIEQRSSGEQKRQVEQNTERRLQHIEQKLEQLLQLLQK
ncbi:hypothetical protein AWZ03_002735 [Drosophila navojoa]|uniref:Ion transport domain-containing protein n=1 Tax=Drosophila navojoa TaxID=7232 RepID=A0A484BPH1_DRONA|nr:transient receptor potential cation channel protein painless [Drosophila navojoa]TDG50746.1 hypothetical protein AWZ03_002735 [Drosophila navojoa]